MLTYSIHAVKHKFAYPFPSTLQSCHSFLPFAIVWLYEGVYCSHQAFFWKEDDVLKTNFYSEQETTVSSTGQLHPRIPLSALAPNQVATVESLKNEGSMRQRLLDLGLTKDTTVCCVGRSPAGDPSAYDIRGAIIALREQDSRSILVRILERGNEWD